MKDASKSGFSRVLSVLLSLAVVVGMIPVSIGSAAAESSEGASGENDLKATLYIYDGEDPFYYQSTDWVAKDIFAEVEGDVGQEVTAAYFKKSGDSSWNEADFKLTPNITLRPVENPEETQPEETQPEPTINEEQTTAPADDNQVGDGGNPQEEGTEPNTEPPQEEPEIQYEEVITSYHLRATFWVEEPESTYDGTYDFQYSFSDGSNHTYQNFFSVKIDNKLDVFEASVKGNSQEWKNKCTIEGSVEDNGSGLKRVYYIMNSKEQTITDKNGDFSFDITEDFDGNIKLYAEDQVGNSRILDIKDVRIDKTAPEVINLKTSEESWTNHSVTVTGQASDNLSGVKEVRYILVDKDAEISVEKSETAELKEDNSFSFVLDAEAEKNFSGSAVVYAVDKAGNSSYTETNVQAVSVNIDTQECVITELSVTPDTWTNGEVTIKGKITDNASGVDKDSVKYRLYSDGGEKGEFQKVGNVEAGEDGVATFEISLNADGKMESGVYRAELTALDFAGNSATVDEAHSPAAYPLTVRIQNDPPKVEAASIKVDYGVSVEEDKKYTNKEVTISGEVVDTLSGIGEKKGGVFLKKASDNEEQWEKAVVKELENGKYEFSLKLAPQTYTGTYQIKTVNEAGAESDGTLKTPIVYQDNAAPVFDKDSISIPTDWAASALITGKVSDQGDAGIKRVAYRLEGTENWTDIDGVKFSEDNKDAEFSFILQKIEYNGTIEFLCEDKAGEVTGEKGNQTTLLSEEKVALDIVAPKLESAETEYKGGSWTNADIIITGKVSDNGGNVNSGIEGVYFAYTDTEGKEVTVRADELKDDGSYTLTVKAADFSVAQEKEGGYFGDIRVYTVDNAKIISETSVTISVALDTESGKATLVSSVADWTQELTVEVEFIDANSGKPISSGFGSVEYTDDENVTKPLGENENEIKTEGNKLILTMPKTDYKGKYTFVFKDKAGNPATAPVVITALQDITPPEMGEVKAEPVNKWTNKTVRVSGKCADNKAERDGQERLDYNSGIKEVLYKKSADTEWTSAEVISKHDSGTTADFSFDIKVAENDFYSGTYDVKCVDNALNESKVTVTGEIKIDEKAPVFTEIPKYSDGSADFSGEKWVSGKITVTGAVADSGSGIDAVEIKKTGLSAPIRIPVNDMKYNPEKNHYEFTFTSDAQEFEGEYTFYCVDMVDNESEKYTQKVRQDNKAPSLKVSHNDGAVNWLAKVADAITFHAFNFSEKDNENNLDYTLEIEDKWSGIKMDSLTMICEVSDKTYTFPVKEGTEVLKNLKIDDSENPGKKVKISFTLAQNLKDAVVTFTVTDNAKNPENNGNEKIEKNEKERIIVDNIAPNRTVTYPEPISRIKDREHLTNLNDSNVSADDRLYYDDKVNLLLDIKEKNFYPADINAKGDAKNLPGCTLTVTKDGEEYTAYQLSNWSDEADDHHKATLTLEKEGCYVVRMNYEDRSLNKMQEFVSPSIIIDKTPPEMQVTYDNTVVRTKDGVEYFGKKAEKQNDTDPNLTATIRIKEDNFNPSALDITVDAKKYIPGSTNPVEVEGAYSLGEWGVEGEYHTITVSFDQDAIVTFDAVYTDYCKKSAQHFKSFVLDTQAPYLLKTEFDTPISEIFKNNISFGYYDSKVNVTLTLFDETSGVYHFDCKGVAPPQSEEHKVSAINKVLEAQSFDMTSENGVSVAQFTIPKTTLAELTENDNYDSLLVVTATDLSENPFVENALKDFKTGKTNNNYEFIFDNRDPVASIVVDEPTQKVDGVAYYSGEFKGHITVDEANFVGDLLYKDLKLEIQEDDLQDTKYDYEFDSETEAWDNNGTNDIWTNSFTLKKEGRYSYIFNYRDPSHNEATELKAGNMVIDTTPPEGRITNKTSEKRIRDGVKYYDGSILLELEIKEHNFRASDVKFYADGQLKILNWVSEGDIHTASYVFEEEGVHSYHLTYNDLALNPMEENDTNRDSDLVIDLHDPILTIDYSYDKNEGYDEDGRKYLNHTCTALVTVEEENFCEEDTHINVSALNAAGADVANGEVFGEWKHDGKYHTRSISFSGDANYTVDATCLDLAMRSIKTYTPDKFTVDTVKPGEIHFSYSDPVSTSTIGGTEYRFYNAQVKVDISCYDETSGIKHFDYHGIVAPDASSVNKEVYKTALEGTEITQNGTSFSASFYIPQSALVDANQFNGTITSGAEDRSGNTNETAATTRLVCDNIAPVGKITPSKKVQTAENMDFYNDSITLSIEITEANFYKEDVEFKVDDVSQSLDWSQSGDQHTATYVISTEGEHRYSMNYKDRSNNTMTPTNPITNERVLVIDKTKPAITIDKSITNESANREETISFILTVTDKYFTSSDIQPKLEGSVVVKDEDKDEDEDEDEDVAPSAITGKLETKPFNLGTPDRSGESYVYKINNLDIDGVYHFTCSAKDYAGNENNKFDCYDANGKLLEDVENFKFSVNRNGSAFWVVLENVDNNGYTKSNEIKVTLNEVNVDKTDEETAALKITDDNATKTVELNSTTYDGNVSKGEGGWYKSTYTLDNSYFTRDSHYGVALTTHDKAGNINISSDSDTALVDFTVDRTAPIISSNVSDNQIIKSNGYEIEANIAEDNLDIDQLGVFIDEQPVEFNREGSVVKFHFDNGTHNIRIKAGDLANNIAEDYTVSNITVSDNPIVLWFANKPLFFATTGGALALIGVIVFLLVRKSRK